MAQLVVLTTKGYIDHDRLIPAQRLRKFFETDSLAGIQPHHTARLQYLLTALDVAKIVDDVDEPSLRLHQLNGFKKQRWAIHVNGN